MKFPLLLGLVAFCSLFTAVGAFLAWKEWHNLRRALAAAAWPVTEGRILNSRLDVDSSGEGTTYQAKVQYDYRVNDHAFTGERVHHSLRGGSNRAVQEALVDKLAAGTRVQVRYDPEEPGESTLTTGFTREALPALLMGLLCFSFGLLFTGIILATGTTKSDLADRLVIIERAAGR